MKTEHCFTNLFLLKFVVSKKIQSLFNFISCQTLACTIKMLKNFFNGYILLHEANSKLAPYK